MMVDYHRDVPRDFTDLVNGYESTIRRLRAENERLKTLLTEIDKRVPEYHLLGDKSLPRGFQDEIDAALGISA